MVAALGSSWGGRGTVVALVALLVGEALVEHELAEQHRVCGVLGDEQAARGGPGEELAEVAAADDAAVAASGVDELEGGGRRGGAPEEGERLAVGRPGDGAEARRAVPGDEQAGGACAR